MKRTLSILCFMLLMGGLIHGQGLRRRRPIRNFEATAYARGVVTASGRPVRRGEVAADTRILPMGSKIEVRSAGAYSGIYTVADTGPAIRGRHIDIFIPSTAQAKRFGRKVVGVRVLHWGRGRHVPNRK